MIRPLPRRRRAVRLAILSNTEANFGEAEALAFARLALDQGAR